jgi:hypothetical protein
VDAVDARCVLLTTEIKPQAQRISSKEIPATSPVRRFFALGAGGRERFEDVTACSVVSPLARGNGVRGVGSWRGETSVPDGFSLDSGASPALCISLLIRIADWVALVEP